MATPLDPRELLRALGPQRLPNTSLTVGPSAPRRQVAPTGRTATPPRPAPQVPQGSPLERVIAEARSTGRGRSPQQEDLPWYKEAAASVLGNGVVQGALKPLDWLQTGGRAAIAGYENLARALPDWAENAVDLPATVATGGLNKALGVSIGDIDETRELEGDWWKRATTSEYGWGTASKDGAGLWDEALGDKWGNRMRGFTGDVLFDPTTWMTAGSAQAAGKTSRMSLAAKAASTGQFTDKKIADIGRKGVAFLTDNERALLGVERSGVRFAGQRIPLSGGVARTVGKATSGARHQVFGRRPWQYIARTPEGEWGVDLTEAYRVLNEANYQGRMTPGSAAALISLDEGLRMYGKAVQVPASNVAAKIFDGTNEEQRRLITKALEAGDESALRELNQELYRIAKDNGVVLGDLGKNYITHMWTPEAREFLSKRQLRDSNKKVIDLSASGATKERKITGGIIYVGDEMVDVGKGTIEEINRALSEKFKGRGVEKWLEDDARKLTSSYIDMVRKDIAITAAFQDALRDHPNVFEWLDNVSDDVIDKVATKTANKQAGEALREVLKTRKAAFKVEAENARKDAVKLRDALVSRFTQQAEKQDEIGARFAQAVKAAQASGKDLDTQARQVAKDVVDVRKQAEKRLAAVEKEFFELEEQLDAARIRLAGMQDNKPKLAAEFVAMGKKRAELLAQVEAARGARERVEELTEQLAKLFDSKRALEANLDDPDFMQRFAQELVPEQTIERQVLAQAPEQKLTTAKARLDVVERKIEALTEDIEGLTKTVDRRDIDSMEYDFDEVSTLGRAIDTVEQGLKASKDGEVAAQEAVDAAMRDVARGRSQREGAEAVRTDVPLENTIKGPRRTLQEGVGAKAEEKSRGGVLKALDQLFDVVGEKEALRRRWTEAGKELRDANDIESIANRQMRNLKRGVERVEPKAKAVRESIDTAVREQPWAKYKIETQMEESAKLMHRLWLIKDEMAKVADDQRVARRGVHDALQSTAGLRVGADQGIERRLADAQAALDAALAELPEPERKLLKALEELRSAKESTKSYERMLKNMERQRDRAARLSTPERQRAALLNVRDILEKHLEANPNYSAPVYETVTETVPGPQLPPLAQLQDEMASIPPSDALAPPEPIRKAIEKVQLKAKLTASDIKKGGQIPKETLQASPSEVAKRYLEIKDRLRAVVSGIDRVGQAEYVDEANRLAEFMMRYKAAVDAGAEPGDQLATRVSRELFKSDKKKFEGRIKDLEVAVDVPGPKREKVLREKFSSQLLDVADELDTAEKRLSGLRYQLKKMGGVDTGEVREQLGEAVDSVAGERAAITFAIKEAKEDVDGYRAMLADMIRMVSPKARDEKVGFTSGRYSGTKANPSFGGTYAFHPNQRSIAQGFIVPRPGDKAGAAIELGSKRASQEKAAYYRNMTDVIRGVVRKGETTRDAVRKQDELLNRMYNQLPENYRAALLQDTKTELADAQRKLRVANRDMNRLGKAPEKKGQQLGEVVADWRDVLFQTGEGAIEKRRSKLLELMGYYDQAKAKLGEQIGEAKADLRSTSAELGEVKRTIKQGEAAEAQLMGPPAPTPSQRAKAETAAQIDDLTTRRDAAVARADALDGVLRRIDEAAADRFKEIDQQRVAANYMVDVNGDWQKQAKDAASELRKRASTAKGLGEFGGKNVSMDRLRELDELAKVAGESPEMAQTFAMHAAYVDTLTRLEGEDMTIKQMEMFLKRAKDGKLTKVFKFAARDGWNQLDAAFQPAGRQMAYSDDIAKSLSKLGEAADDGGLWTVLDRLTQFFKTYATATPGFHVRNAMSATFMNMSDGVSVKSHREAMRYWKQYLDDPQGFMRSIKKDNPKVHDAFQATFGSGAGGNFSAAELGDVHNKVMDNRWTRWNRRQGEKVEGVVRLAVALDTIMGKSQGDVRDAVRRIERLHFDYSKLSKLDKGMKRIIPFWTFMSRNLPLQMQQMYMRPGIYSAFNHLADNMGVDVEAMPQWLADKSAMALGGNDEDGYFSMAPDLPHLNLAADLETFDLSDPTRVLSNLNPVAIAPVEAISNRNFYYDGPLQRDGEWGGWDGRAMHAITSIAAPAAQGMRLTGQGRYQGRATESIANFFGVPYRNISPERMQAEMRRRAFEGE